MEATSSTIELAKPIYLDDFHYRISKVSPTSMTSIMELAKPIYLNDFHYSISKVSPTSMASISIGKASSTQMTAIIVLAKYHLT